MKNIESAKVCKNIASIFVSIENNLRENPSITIKEFCASQNVHPVDLLYSSGFNAMLLISSIVPMKEVLDKDKFPEWDTLRKCRNALCHGTYQILDGGKIDFKDRDRTISMTVNEVIKLCNSAIASINNNDE